MWTQRSHVVPHLPEPKARTPSKATIKGKWPPPRQAFSPTVHRGHHPRANQRPSRLTRGPRLHHHTGPHPQPHGCHCASAGRLRASRRVGPAARRLSLQPSSSSTDPDLIPPHRPAGRPIDPGRARASPPSVSGPSLAGFAACPDVCVFLFLVFSRVGNFEAAG
ncbi:hypothetical protein BDA96_02G046100 [Sorghum bicolor]|uniref:Uncharacterized protein n=2 Tax=Sorghum bicolor TaxID=4558 RepID=A0A921RMN0_SORBI|nr:hypothetical protein BDA96_02G046100 [Sorghum bicolor]KXG34473.1 hypothetical protein SORBI_3002G046200 [Sorghum bicolor]